MIAEPTKIAHTDRPIREMTERGKTITRFLVTLGVPLLIVLFGLLRYARIRSRRSTDFLAAEAS